MLGAARGGGGLGAAAAGDGGGGALFRAGAQRRVLVVRLLEPLLERAEPRHRAVELAAAVVDLLAQRGVVLLER